MIIVIFADCIIPAQFRRVFAAQKEYQVENLCVKAAIAQFDNHCQICNFEDFLTYRVYILSWWQAFGGHAVEIVGYGIEMASYWRVDNS